MTPEQEKAINLITAQCKKLASDATQCVLNGDLEGLKHVYRIFAEAWLQAADANDRK